MTPDPPRRVDLARWKQAQAWELHVWQDSRRKRGWRRLIWPLARPILELLGSPRLEGDDWNHWWAAQFDQYGFLPPAVDEYIELGCGPFTNTRVILRSMRANRVVCSDPLIRHYVDFRGTWLSRECRKGAVLIDDHPLEECPFASGRFDVVVMINVLDHVMDADRCLEHAVRIVKPGGLLVIGQELSEPGDRRPSPYDIGHPIRLVPGDVDRHLEGFTTVLRKDLSRSQGRSPEEHYGTLIYAGRKGRGDSSAKRDRPG